MPRCSGPASQITLSLRHAEAGTPWQPGAVSGGRLQADRLDLALLSQLGRALPLNEALQGELGARQPQGLVTSLDAEWTGALDASRPPERMAPDRRRPKPGLAGPARPRPSPRKPPSPGAARLAGRRSEPERHPPRRRGALDPAPRAGQLARAAEPRQPGRAAGRPALPMAARGRQLARAAQTRHPGHRRRRDQALWGMAQPARPPRGSSANAGQRPQAGRARPAQVPAGHAARHASVPGRLPAQRPSPQPAVQVGRPAARLPLPRARQGPARRRVPRHRAGGQGSLRRGAQPRGRRHARRLRLTLARAGRCLGRAGVRRAGHAHPQRQGPRGRARRQHLPRADQGLRPPSHRAAGWAVARPLCQRAGPGAKHPPQRLDPPEPGPAPA